MISNQTKTNLKIILAFIVSFFITKILTNTIFFQTGPTINNSFFSRLKINFNNYLSQLNHTLSLALNQTKPNISLTDDLKINKKQNSYFHFEKISPKPTLLPTLTPTAKPKAKLTPILTPTPTKILIKTPTPTKISIAKNLSSSKLGIFVLANYTQGARKILQAGPRIIKFIDPQYQPNFMGVVKEYKQNHPQGIILLRFWNRTQGLKYQVTEDPITSADNFFAKVNEPAFKELGNNLSYFDYLQTPNEFETTPEWWGKEKVVWNGKFWQRLTQLNKNAGIKTCIGGIPVGNVEVNELEYIINELRTIKNLGGAFCYHGYTFDYSTDVNREIQLSLRYRQFYNFFKNKAPDLVSMPLILSEGGVAENGNPKAGYLISQSYQRYKDWLTWFDSELKKDPYVVGVTLFQIGNNTDWSNFNLEPIADWLSDYLKNH